MTAPASSVSANRRELVLIGAGHAHVQVLRSFAMERPPRCRLTLVVDTPLAVYSGMVPGLVAGHYRDEELEIDAVPLARRAGSRVILSAAAGIDPAARRILLEGRPSIPYDLASIDIGSTVSGLDLPGVREHALPTRPVGRFIRRLGELDETARRTERPLRLIIAGGGAAGVELAFTVRERLARGDGNRAGRVPEITVVHAGERVLTGYPRGAVQRVLRQFERRRIALLDGRTVVAAEAGAVRLDDGATLPCDALLWVTGAAGQKTLRGSGLPTDERCFVLVRSTLQVLGHDDLFAAGDCATFADHPATPKAGVHAVRQGPFLIRNLRAALAGDALARYRPQADFLSLLNLGDGTAIGAKWGLAVEGRWVMRWKDRIDRRFMRRFRLLDREGGPLPALPPMDEGAIAMVCGGCASKVGQAALEGALMRLERDGSAGGEQPLCCRMEVENGSAAPRSLRGSAEIVLGLADRDDVAAVELADGSVLATSVDAFRAFTDDPWLVGRIAAVNALSDLEAKGVAPRWAQALVTVPLDAVEKEAEETVYQILSGARAAFDPLGVALIGGHTATAAELAVGFSIQGMAAGRGELLRRHGPLVPGLALVLTKPLGTGVLFHADMAGRARGPWIEEAVCSMLRSNGPATRAARLAGVVAATDVSGFGLAGHLTAMLAGSGCAARLEIAALPALPGALELLARGERSTFHASNAHLRRTLAVAPIASADPRLELLFDPQTAGGLLLALPVASATRAVELLAAAGFPRAATVGAITAGRGDGALVEVVG